MPDTTSRRRRRTPHPTASARLADELSQVVAVVADRADAEGWDQPARLLRVVADGADDLEVGLLPIGDIGGPIGVLPGFVAPAEWLALGVLSEGDARQVGAPTSSSRDGRVRVVHLVHRSGRSASSLCHEGEAPTPLEGPVAGRIDDLLRRALGLPTPPPDASFHELLALLWLDRALGEIGRAPGSGRSFGQLGSWHPATRATAAADDVDELLRARADAWAAGGDEPAAIDAEPVDVLLQCTDQVTARVGWAWLHDRCGRGAAPRLGIDPELAAWFDVGSFSRWILDEWPLLGDLADAVAAQVPAPVAADLGRVLRAWGLDGAA